jgi:hypothetical protein
MLLATEGNLGLRAHRRAMRPEVREGVSRMTGTLLNAGDEIDVVVTSVKPFALFVESDSGARGLVRGGGAAVGTMVRVRLIEFDAAESRFSAQLVA